MKQEIFSKAKPPFFPEYFLKIGEIIGLNLETTLTAWHLTNKSIFSQKKLSDDLEDAWMLCRVALYVASKNCEEECRPRDIFNGVSLFRWLLSERIKSSPLPSTHPIIFSNEEVIMASERFEILPMEEYWVERDLLLQSESNFLICIDFFFARTQKKIISSLLYTSLLLSDIPLPPHTPHDILSNSSLFSKESLPLSFLNLTRFSFQVYFDLLSVPEMENTIQINSQESFGIIIACECFLHMLKKRAMEEEVSRVKKRLRLSKEGLETSALSPFTPNNQLVSMQEACAKYMRDITFSASFDRAAVLRMIRPQIERTYDNF